MAITSWPGRSARESPKLRRDEVRRRDPDDGDVGVGVLTDESASHSRPSGSVTRMRDAPSTTWLLVRIRPSAANTNPEPLPAACPPRLAVVASRAGVDIDADDGWRHDLDRVCDGGSRHPANGHRKREPDVGAWATCMTPGPVPGAKTSSQ